MSFTYLFTDFDDTIFPTTHLRGAKLTPLQIQELRVLDFTISLFIQKNITHTRFRIITRASLPWFEHTLKFMSSLYRLYIWGYITVFPCGDRLKSDVVQNLLQNDTNCARFVCMGDQLEDVNMLDKALKSLGLQNKIVHTFLFVKSPETSAIRHQWVHLSKYWTTYCAKEESSSHHFVQDEFNR